MKIYNLRMLTLLAMLACLVPAMALNLDFNPSTKHNLDISTANGLAKITTTGNDPYISFKALASAISHDNTILSFEYTAPKDINSVIIYMSPLAGTNKEEMEAIIAKANEIIEIATKL